MTSLKTSIKTITYLSDIGCLEIQGPVYVAQRGVSISSTGTRVGEAGKDCDTVGPTIVGGILREIRPSLCQRRSHLKIRLLSTPCSGPVVQHWHLVSKPVQPYEV